MPEIRWPVALRSINRDCYTPFNERYRLDGLLARIPYDNQLTTALLELRKNHKFHEFKVDKDLVVRVIYDPEVWNTESIENELGLIYRDSQPYWIQERHHFNEVNTAAVKKLLRDRNEWRSSTSGRCLNTYLIDAWVCPNNRLFWTIDKINLKDVIRNIDAMATAIKQGK